MKFQPWTRPVEPKDKFGGYGSFRAEMERLKQWPGMTSTWAQRKLEREETTNETASIRDTEARQGSGEHGTDIRRPRRF